MTSALDTDTRREVLAAEHALYQAQISENFAVLERMLSPDLVYVHSTAVAESREEYLAGAAEGLYEYESIEMPDARVRVHGSVALLDGICTMRVGKTRQAKDLIRLLVVLVWAKEDGAWRLVHRHATRMAAAMNPDAIAGAARVLSESRRSRVLLDALPDAFRPMTLDDAHAIQELTATQLDEPIAGWKVSATPEGRVARGALLRSRLFPSGARVSAAAMPLLGVEAEVAFRFVRDLPPRARPYEYDEVAAAVVALPAIEVVDSRFRGYPNAPLLDRIADCMSNGAFIHGTEQPRWREFDLESLDVELVIDGQSIVHRAGGHPTKDPLLPAVALVNDLRSGTGVKCRADRDHRHLYRSQLCQAVANRCRALRRLRFRHRSL